MFINIHSHFSDIQNLTVLQAERQEINQWCSIGIHPWNARLDFAVNNNFDLLRNHNCLAIGEIGLDKLKGPDLETQTHVFEQQIALSESLELPVIIHCVKAWNEIKNLKRKLNPSQPWVFHGFSKLNILDDVLSEGLYVSFGEAIIRNKILLDAACKIPHEKVFLETDDSNISIETIYGEFAKAKQITLQELKEIQFNNFKRVFKKWKSG